MKRRLKIAARALKREKNERNRDRLLRRAIDRLAEISASYVPPWEPIGEIYCPMAKAAGYMTFGNGP